MQNPDTAATQVGPRFKVEAVSVDPKSGRIFYVTKGEHTNHERALELASELWLVELLTTYSSNHAEHVKYIAAQAWGELIRNGERETSEQHRIAIREVVLHRLRTGDYSIMLPEGLTNLRVVQVEA